MKSSADIIQWLNRQLQHELTAINQYFLHARMYENWGLNSLNKREYEESIEEMKHADALIRRILFLEGLPNLQELGKLLIGEKAEECVECDLKLEMTSRETLLAAISASETAKDYVSRELFKEILEDTENHIDWLETQLDVMQKVGIQNWLQSQM
jgi:bacterioferritin